MKKVVFAIFLALLSIGSFANNASKLIGNVLRDKETGVYHSSCGTWTYSMTYEGGLFAAVNRGIRYSQMADAIENGCRTKGTVVHFDIAPGPESEVDTEEEPNGSV